eukprot:gene23317-33254_t
MEAWMNLTHPDVRTKKKAKDALRQTRLLEYTCQSGTTYGRHNGVNAGRFERECSFDGSFANDTHLNSAGFPGLQGQLCQPASTVGAPALQLAAVPDSSALTGSLLMPGFGSVVIGNHPRSHSSVASAAASAAASEAAMLALAEVLVGGRGAGADADAGAGAGAGQ